LAVVVSSSGNNGTAVGYIDNEVVPELDDEDLASDVNSSQKMAPIGNPSQ